MNRWQIFLILFFVTILLTAFFNVLVPTNKFQVILTNSAVPHNQYYAHDNNLSNPSPQLALQKLKETVAQDPFERMAHCHEEAHKIGNTSYELLGEKAYAYADPMCGGGFLHGVIEQAFIDQGLDYLQTVTHEQCKGDILESCLHGVGHGIHKLSPDLSLSIRTCSQISASGTDCYDGVFMDIFDTHNAGEEAITLTDALLMCENTVETAQNSCYFYLPRIIKNSEAQKIVDICSSKDIKSGWAACATGSGVFFMKQTSGFNKQIATEYCSLYTDKNLKTLCYQGVQAYEKYGNVENTKWH